MTYIEPMKMRNLTLWSSVLLTMSFPLAGDSAQATGSTLNQTNALMSPTNAATGPPPSAPKPPTAPTAIVKPSLPANVALSPTAAEVVRMADANVEPNVILSFVNNANGTFNLGSSQIIYLRDLGVKDEVLTAMIQHDQTLTGGAVSAANTTDTWQSTTPNPPAPAPAYAPASGQPAPPEAAPSSPPPAGVNNNFYGALSPYGQWVNIDGYGWCWQPTAAVTDPNWRPYANGGRWVYTDDGWYWQSDYTWGGVAFHYGRWFDNPACGWCWWPDNVWAPSWVTWAYNDAYCGWAPLPPFSCWTAGLGFTYCGSPIGFGFGFGLGYGCYSFVPWGGFCAYNPCLYGVGPGQAAGIYGNSTRVNNIINGNGNTIINGGIPVDRVAQLSRSEIRRGTIRDVAGTPGRVQPDLVRRQNGQLTVFRPTTAGGSVATRGSASTAPAASKNITALRQELPGGARVATAGASYPTTRGAASQFRPGAVARTSGVGTTAASRPAESRSFASARSTGYWQNNTAASRPAASATRSSSAQYAPSFSRTAPAAAQSAARLPRSGSTSYWQNNAGSLGAARPSEPSFSSSARSSYSTPSQSWSSSAVSRPLYSPRYSSSFGSSSYHSYSSPSFSSRPSGSYFSGRSFGSSGFSASRPSSSFFGGGGGSSRSFGGGGGGRSFGGGGGGGHSFGGGGGGRGTR